MKTKLIELEDGILVEVAANENDVEQIAGGMAQRVNSAVQQIKPLIIKTVKPVVEAWKELNQDMHIAEAEVELNLSFEGEGNIYITKTKASANYSVKLVLRPPSKVTNTE